MFDSSALVSSDFLRPKNEGRAVNAHVVRSACEPGPDFTAMNRVINSGLPIIEGSKISNDADRRDIPKNP